MNAPGYPGRSPIEQIINLKRYPIDDLETASSAKWLKQIRISLDLDGSCTFPDFVQTTSLEQLVREADSISHLAYPGPTEVSPYFFNYQLGAGMSLPASHPLKRKGKRNLSQVAADLIPGEFLLSQLFHSREMLDFLGAIIDTRVYCNEDPYQSLNISVMDRGGCQQWHFDSGSMVTTLLLQEPDGGGDFEYAPALRSDKDENYDAVQSVIDGDRSRVRTIKLKAGTLSLFRGHYSMHRVTRVTGSRQRLQAILGYTTVPGFMGKKESSILHYGPRVADIEATSPRYPD